jgi:predicted regulator of Ras-like GTPase activity (Roadblock/LC7/MglB family)
MLRPAHRWSLEEDAARKIDQLLKTFLETSRSRSALLIDRSGQLIEVSGIRPGFDSTSFASLAAADFAASEQLATMVGDEEFTSLFHQGEKESMYLVDVARRVVLVILFDDEATLGMIRIRVRPVVKELTAIINTALSKPAGADVPEKLGEGWAEDVEEELDRLFGNR